MMNSSNFNEPAASIMEVNLTTGHKFKLIWHDLDDRDLKDWFLIPENSPTPPIAEGPPWLDIDAAAYASRLTAEYRAEKNIR